MEYSAMVDVEQVHASVDLLKFETRSNLSLDIIMERQCVQYFQNPLL